MADVILVRWPEEREDAARLVAAGAAVLYLVDLDAEPPVPTSCLEDWVRMPGDDRDLRGRVMALETRAVAHRMPPTVDGAGRLRYHGKLLPLSTDEASLARVLAARFGTVVPDIDLAAVLGDDAGLRNHMTHLRSRVRPVDLHVRRIRGQGYALQAR